MKKKNTTCFLVDYSGCTDQNSTTSEPLNVLQIQQKKMIHKNNHLQNQL